MAGKNIKSTGRILFGEDDLIFPPKVLRKAAPGAWVPFVLNYQRLFLMLFDLLFVVMVIGFARIVSGYAQQMLAVLAEP